MPKNDLPEATKVNETTFFGLLYFAFFGEGRDAVSQAGLKLKPTERRAAEEARAEKAEKLVKVLTIVFNAIRSEQFDKERHPSIDAPFHAKYFKGGFSRFADYVKSDRWPLRSEKAIIFRPVFAALAEVARDAFDSPPDYQYVADLRKICIRKNDDDLKARADAFSLVRNELFKIENRPSDWAVSLDREQQPVIKIRRENYFPSPAYVNSHSKGLAGCFLVYRQAFAPLNERHYIREYLVIENKKYGLTCVWHSVGRREVDPATFEGVGFLTDGAFWFITHCDNPFKRIRVLAGNLHDWQRHTEHETDHCQGSMMSHSEGKDGDKIPQMRPAIFKMQLPGEAPAGALAEYLTREKMKSALSKKEFDLIAHSTPEG